MKYFVAIFCLLLIIVVQAMPFVVHAESMVLVDCQYGTRIKLDAKGNAVKDSSGKPVLEPAVLRDANGNVAVLRNGNGEPITDPEGRPIVEIECGFQDIINEIKKLINFAFLLAVPITIFALAWSGIKILLAVGNTSKIAEARRTMTMVIVGFLFVLCAWLIVYTLTSCLVQEKFYSPFLGGNSAVCPSSN
jgi:hypothetical protein